MPSWQIWRPIESESCKSKYVKSERCGIVLESGVEELERESDWCGIVFERGVENMERESERCGKVWPSWNNFLQHYCQVFGQCNDSDDKDDVILSGAHFTIIYMHLRAHSNSNLQTLMHWRQPPTWKYYGFQRKRVWDFTKRKGILWKIEERKRRILLVRAWSLFFISPIKMWLMKV